MPPEIDIRPKLSPARLANLAGNVVLRRLTDACARLDSMFDVEGGAFVKPDQLNLPPNTPSGKKKDAGGTVSRLSSAASDVSEISPALSAKVVRSILAIKSYIRTNLPKKARLDLLRFSQTFASMSCNIPIMRFVMTSDVDNLDFRGTDCWLLKRVVLSDYTIASSGHKTVANVPPLEFIPPNEFDWYSADRMGRILSMNDSLELFSIINASHCMEKLKSLKINVRRASYYTCRKESMHIFDSVFTKLTNITELVVRGMADDNLMKIVGRSYMKLKLFDISFSKFVTDEGIRHLFFEDIDAPPILYTLPSWIQHSSKNMNPVSRSLEVLDFSHTRVTWDSVSMMSCVPGAFMFRRSFATCPSTAFAHVVFVRKQVRFLRQFQLHNHYIVCPQPELSIPFHKDDSTMGSVLQRLGVKIKTELMKLLEASLWEGCHLSIFKGAKQYWKFAFVTSSKDEKLVHAYFVFNGQGIQFFYSLLPVSMDVLGEACPKLEFIQGVLIGKWTHIATVFERLTCVDIFAVPYTLASVLRQCHNLIKVRFRVMTKPITDEDIIGSVSISGCKETLQEFWIAPGSYKATGDHNDVAGSTSDSEAVPDLCSRLIGNGEHAEVDDLCKLSIRCACKLIKLCKRLKRLGDLTWWSLATAPAVSNLCYDLKALKLGIIITFDDILLPDFEVPKKIKKDKEPDAIPNQNSSKVK